MYALFPVERAEVKLEPLQAPVLEAEVEAPAAPSGGRRRASGKKTLRPASSRRQPDARR